MEQEITSIVQKNEGLLKRLPHLRNGLILSKLKNKYPNQEILMAMDPIDTEQFTKYGNYEEYYDYRTSDDRIDTLKPYLNDKEILDIGCHMGVVAKDVYLQTDYKFYLGCDIDHTLIRKAIRVVTDAIIENEYRLPVSVGRYLNLEEKKKLLNKYNLQFNYADIMKHIIKYKFDIVLCLSVIKWIHLEHHDAGLQRFLEMVYSLLNTSGIFVLELHDSDSYWKKLHPLNYETYLSLQISPEDIPRILIEQVGFSRFEILGLQDQIGGFKRRNLYLFYK